MNATARDTFSEAWERTMEIRWMPMNNDPKPRFRLEQAWRSTDGRLEWRVVPSVMYSSGPEQGR